MDFKSYQEATHKTFIDNQEEPDLILARIILGISGEAGEISEKVKKYLRDTKKSPKDRIELAIKLHKEIGDLLWYISETSNLLNLDLEKIAKDNIKKLADRQRRNKLKGEGDER